jgi:CDP-glucose 4,6-dehydratase
MGGVAVDAQFWRGRRVLVTGHTGFKGSWLCLWLQAMGAELHGFALDAPTMPCLFDEARVGDGMDSRFGDVRDFEAVRSCVEDVKPEIVIHMAAQSLVRQSYSDPIATFGTNVMGTVHVLEASRLAASVRVVVNVTSDKCYENLETDQPYREDAAFGGYDPYSSSKGCAELVTAAYRRSFGAQARVAMGSARAGNVIGGGDWSADRLVPDVLHAFEKGEAVRIRSPHAVRPWQHVLEPLSGYLVLAQRLRQDGDAVAEGWNFGPEDGDARPVEWVVEHLADCWGEGASWERDGADHPHEARLLRLDTAKARRRLDWAPTWRLPQALSATVQWHRGWLAGEDVRQLSLRQIAEFVGGNLP